MLLIVLRAQVSIMGDFRLMYQGLWGVMGVAYTAELIIELNAVLEPR